MTLNVRLHQGVKVVRSECVRYDKRKRDCFANARNDMKGEL